jgi:hypothetical protein
MCGFEAKKPKYKRSVLSFMLFKKFPYCSMKIYEERIKIQSFKIKQKSKKLKHIKLFFMKYFIMLHTYIILWFNIGPLNTNLQVLNKVSRFFDKPFESLDPFNHAWTSHCSVRRGLICLRLPALLSILLLPLLKLLTPLKDLLLLLIR